jgi:hypothetical protein
MKKLQEILSIDRSVSILTTTAFKTIQLHSKQYTHFLHIFFANLKSSMMPHISRVIQYFQFNFLLRILYTIKIQKNHWSSEPQGGASNHSFVNGPPPYNMLFSSNDLYLSSSRARNFA